MARIEHAAAAGAQHVPVQLEQAEPRRMQERADGLFLVELALGCELQRVDARQRAVLAVANKRLDGADNGGIGRIAERAEQRAGLVLDVVHGKGT
jgi:hypothetical protein